jgi:hypothetical protein
MSPQCQYTNLFGRIINSPKAGDLFCPNESQLLQEGGCFFTTLITYVGSSTVEHSPVKGTVEGSNPSLRAKRTGACSKAGDRDSKSPWVSSILTTRANILLSSNGRTAGFEPVNVGSIPTGSTNK